MKKTTDFAKRVKIRLIEMEKPQTWLIAQITEKTGLYVDSSYLSKLYTGQRKAPKIAAAIRNILELDD